MVSTKHSVRYTYVALDSFWKNTVLLPGERFYLIDNDGHLPQEITRIYPWLEVIRNQTPKSFSQNVNSLLALCEQTKADLYFLNNDLVFTPHWLLALALPRRSLLSPLSNREVPYRVDNFEVGGVLKLEDYLGKEITLEAIAKVHSERFFGYEKVLSLPFFCIKIPFEIYQTVGLLDESFGKGGAEDNDYCLRTIMAGYDVEYAKASYVLHFNGKSTWNGAETDVEELARRERYETVFREKWGEKLLELAIRQNNQFVQNVQPLASLAQGRNFRSLITALKY